MFIPRLVLASTSPYRRELLARLRLPFEVRAPAVDEGALHGEAARDTALRLAQAKARAASAEFPQALVIGCDQVADVPTTVCFRQYGDDEIEHYLERERPYDCAGSAKIEGLGIVLVARVRGDDPSALIGLPLMRLVDMLRNEGVAVV